MCNCRLEQRHTKDKIIIRIACSIGGFALILLCVGLGLPTWYVGYSPNTRIIMVTANYFYTCHIPTDETSTGFICVSYNSYICNESIPIGCQNETTLGCINPVNSAISYQYVDAPITYISLEDLQRVRASGGTAIVGIIFLAISIGLTLTLSFVDWPRVFLYIPLVLLYISNIFLVVALVTGSLVIRYYHVGCSLFVTGTMITFLFTIVGAFVVGRLKAISPRIGADEAYRMKQVNDNTR
jgi:hypothetical protein